MKYNKAIVGAIVAGAAAFVGELVKAGVTGQWLVIVGAAVVGLGVVFQVPNKVDPVTAPPPDVAAIMAAAVADYHRSLSTIQAIAAATDQAVAPAVPATVPIPPGPVQVITPTP